MSTFSEVNPETLIDEGQGTPEHGRGAWTREGIGFDYRYMLAPEGQAKLGTECEVSLAHWAVGAGVRAIQARLEALDILDALPKTEWGVYGTKTSTAVRTFQSTRSDPETQRRLVEDGTVGRSDARALFAPVVARYEAQYKIPRKYLLGQTNHESAMDPGAVGYFIYYPDYRGVDRGLSQINSRSHAEISWMQAFRPSFALDYSAKRLRDTFDSLRKNFPDTLTLVVWDAAICSHNNPAAGVEWARLGHAPSDQAAAYVNAVKNARF